MNALVLILAVCIPFPLCLFRMKKYRISLKQMLLIYLVFSVVGAIGACIGSAVDGGTIAGKRLYGLVIFDTMALLIMSRVLKMEVGHLGDYIALPIMATCFASKIDCIVKGCCYGFTLYQLEMQQPVRFPSAILEMIVWAIMTVLLIVLERSKKSTNTLWPIGLIWFGSARFLADFLRGSKIEKEILLLGLTGGQFWSLVTLIIGLVFLYLTVSKLNSRKPTAGEFFKAMMGRSIYSAIEE